MQGDREKSIFLLGLSPLLLLVAEVVWYIGSYLRPAISVGLTFPIMLASAISLCCASLPSVWKWVKVDTRNTEVKVLALMVSSAVIPMLFYRDQWVIVASLCSISLSFMGYRSNRNLPYLMAGELVLLENVLANWPWKGRWSDEFAILYVAAERLLKGIDPYIPGATSTAIVMVPQQYLTPLTTGGFVDQPNYPPLSFLVLVPAILLKQTFLPVIVSTLSILPMVFNRWGREAGAVAGILCLSADWVYLGSPPPLDFLWSTSLSFSYYLFLMGRERSAGILYGVALSLKQLPLFVLFPYLYSAYREYGRRGLIRFSLGVLTSLAVFNLPFLILSPWNYVNGVLTPMSSHLLGIGMGISQLSFTDLYYLPPQFFTSMELLYLAAVWWMYAKFYDRLKYAIFALPTIPLLLGYRVLLSYLFYWVIPSSIAASQASRMETSKTLKIPGRTAIALALISLILVPTFAGLTLHQQGNEEGSLQITPLFVEIEGGQVKEIEVNVTYISKVYNSTPIYFRAFSHNQIGSGYDANGILLSFQGVDSFPPNFTITVILSPTLNLTWSPPIEIVGYYAEVQGHTVLNYTDVTVINLGH